MDFTADRIDAIKEYEYGILEEVFPKPDFLNQVITYANKIIHNGPLALQLAKQAINQGIDMNLKDGLNLEHEFYKKTIPTEDRMEGDRKSTRLNSSHVAISYAVFCLIKINQNTL